MLQYKSAAFELKAEPDDEGVFEGYASTFGNVDQGMDVMERGAFRKSLASGRKVKLLWQHDTSKVIGVPMELREDERGLYIKGRLLKDIAQAREAMALMRAGAIDSMSIGYRTIKAIPEAGGRVRKLIEVDLFEASLITFPMNEMARITDVKSIRTEREFEAFLRDAGYSRREAAALTLHGFKAISGQRDAGPDDAQNEGLQALMEQLRQLQENSQCLVRTST